MNKEHLGTFVSIYLNGQRFDSKEYEILIDQLIQISKSKYRAEVLNKISTYVEGIVNKIYNDDKPNEIPKERKEHIESKILTLKEQSERTKKRIKAPSKALLINDENDDSTTMVDIDNMPKENITLGKYDSIKSIMTDKTLSFQDKMNLTKAYIDKLNESVESKSEVEPTVEPTQEVRRKTVKVKEELTTIEAKDFSNMDVRERFDYLCKQFPTKFTKNPKKKDGKVHWIAYAKDIPIVPQLITFNFQESVLLSKHLSGKRIYRNTKYYIKDLNKHIYFIRSTD